MQPDVIDDVL